MDIDSLHKLADIVIECAGAAVLERIAPDVLAAGKKLIVLSSGALLNSPQIIALASRHRGQVMIPSGAVGGLDIIAAMAEGKIDQLRLITTKPPFALRNAQYLMEHRINLERLNSPVCVFSGSAREAARHFPDNLNVAASLSLAGIGPDRTQVELWADPHTTVNRHEVKVGAASGTVTIQIAAVPSANPKTSALAAQSTLALLRKMHAPLCIG